LYKKEAVERWKEIKRQFGREAGSK
jgi:hypothetical protein